MCREHVAAGSASAVVVLWLVAAGAFGSAAAYARPGGSPLNGDYLATSNGDFAKTNDVRRDQVTVRQVWTITSSCVDSSQCTGDVTSSQGWSAPLTYDGAWWMIDRPVLEWLPCPDGSKALGEQRFRFWGVSPTGQRDEYNTELLAGSDTTNGPSGACGRNQPVVIAMPLRLQRIEH